MPDVRNGKLQMQRFVVVFEEVLNPMLKKLFPKSFTADQRNFRNLLAGARAELHHICALAILVFLGLAALPASAQPAPSPFIVWSTSPGFVKPNIVLQYSSTNGTGVNWTTAQSLHFYNNTPAAQVRDAVQYLQEGIRKMAGQTTGWDVVNQADLTLSDGILLTTLAAAPASIQSDPAVLAALAQPAPGPGIFGIEAREAYYIRSEGNRVIVVANRLEGLVTAIPDLMESVDYEVLGMGPNWIYAPDYSSSGFLFNLERSGRPGYFFRNLWASSGQVNGQGSIYNPATVTLTPPDEYVWKSWNRWQVGRRMRTNSFNPAFGHAMQSRHTAVTNHIRTTGVTDGFLAPTSLGPNASRPVASSTNSGHIWINSDNSDVYSSNGTTWTLSSSGILPASIDVSVASVRQILLDLMKSGANTAFGTNPDEPYGFGTDPEDGTGMAKINLAKVPNWYPAYRTTEGQSWGAYALNGFQGLSQATEKWWWDPVSPDTDNAQSDTVFGLNNWLLREYDKYINSLPAGNDDLSNPAAPIYRQNTKTGKSKKSLIRVDCYSYNYHDVPPNFNLDTAGGGRMRVMVAGYPKHRGRGKWVNLRTELHVAQAFSLLLPNSPSALRWIMSYAGGGDFDIAACVLTPERSPTYRAKMLRDYYTTSNFRSLSSEGDLNFGKLGPTYYMMTKILWNPAVSDADINLQINQYLQRAYGAGWVKMREYHDLAWSGNIPVNGPNLWALCLMKIDEADALIPAGTQEQQRIDDLKTHWYHYYFVDTDEFDGGTASNAVREFCWKAQMGYQVALRFDMREGFASIDTLAVAGPYASAPPRYTPAETAVWWNTIKARWQYTPVTLFTSGTLANGSPAGQVDMNDLVPVAEFGNSPAIYTHIFNSTLMSPITHASAAGQDIGLKIYYDDLAYNGSTVNVPKTIFWGLSKYDAASTRWEDIYDVSMNSTATYQVAISPVPATNPTLRNVLEIRVPAPEPGIYQIKVANSRCNGNRVADINWQPQLKNPNTNNPGAPGATLGGRLTYNYSARALSNNESFYFYYIPKGVSKIEFEAVNGGGGRQIKIYNNFNTSSVKRTITLDDNGASISNIGVHKITLNPGEAGSLMSVFKPYPPYMYSIPMLWAKSPSQLMVPRKIAIADGLTIIP